MKKRKLVRFFYKKKHSKKKCEICKKAFAKYLYMPSGSKYNYFCENCVPRGCSCNFEHFEDKESAEQILEEIAEGYNFYLLDYEESIENDTINLSAKHKKIRDKNEIIRKIKEAIKKDTYRHIIPVPLDEQGREYPCCEFFYDENSFIT